MLESRNSDSAFLKRAVWYTRLLCQDKESKQLLIFTTISLCYSLLQLVFASFFSRSLAILFAGLHSLYSVCDHVIGLVSIVLSTRKANIEYSYGYERFPVLFRFANGTFLVFACFSILVESLQKWIEVESHHTPSHGHGPMKTDYVVIVGLVGLVLSVLRVYLFKLPNEKRAFGGSSSHALKSQRRKLRKQVMLLFLAESAANLAAILATIFIKWGASALSEIYITVAAALTVGYLYLPELYGTCLILLETTPPAFKASLAQCMKQASTVEGVLECHREHFWSLRDGVIVGSLCVRVRADANEQRVLLEVDRKFSPLVTHLTIQIEKDNWDVGGTLINMDNFMNLGNEAAQMQAQQQQQLQQANTNDNSLGLPPQVQLTPTNSKLMSPFSGDNASSSSSSTGGSFQPFGFGFGFGGPMHMCADPGCATPHGGGGFIARMTPKSTSSAAASSNKSPFASRSSSPLRTSNSRSPSPLRSTTTTTTTTTTTAAAAAAPANTTTTRAASPVVAPTTTTTSADETQSPPPPQAQATIITTSPATTATTNTNTSTDAAFATPIVAADDVQQHAAAASSQQQTDEQQQQQQQQQHHEAEAATAATNRK